MNATAADKIRSLSADAKFFGASMFSMMQPGEGKLTFKMIESKPSPRSQAALDELVAAGLVKVEKFNDRNGVTYTPLAVFPRAKAPLEKWPITVPIPGPQIVPASQAS